MQNGDSSNCQTGDTCVADAGYEDMASDVDASDGAIEDAALDAAENARDSGREDGG